MRCLGYVKYFCLILNKDKCNKWYIDTSFLVNSNIKSHASGEVDMDKGSIYIM